VRSSSVSGNGEKVATMLATRYQSLLRGVVGVGMKLLEVC